MDKIRTVALVGAGAVGSYFIGCMFDHLGDDLMVIAEGERLERLKKNGVTINGRNYPVNAVCPEEAAGADLVLAAVKYTGIHDAADMIARIVKDDTIVISLLNGLDSEQIIGGKCGMEHMLYALMLIQSWRQDGSIWFDPEATGGVRFGEKDTKERTERVRMVEELFDRTGVHYEFEPDIIPAMWLKYASNISRNMPQALFGIGSGAYTDSKHVALIRDRLFEEVTKVAAAKGITIPPPSPATISAWNNVKKSARFSTLQDLDAGRPTETDMFLGHLLELAGEEGINVPYCEFMYHAIKTLEEKNEGLFDYGNN